VLVIIATMETEHFSWLALGETEEQAREALIETLRRHGAQSDKFWDEHQPGGSRAWSFGGMDPDPVYALEYYDANFFEIEPGQGLRDGSPVRESA